MIVHIDMDAFYASIEERDRPELVGKPVIVGGTPEGRGVVAAANYVVRQFGVRSAMPAAKAKRLCPHAIFLRPRITVYAKVSEEIRAIFHRYTPLVEPLSLDEAFLDVAGTEKLFGPARELARRIKREIRNELRLTASVGIAPNKFLAKIASDLEKPDGFTVVETGREQEFLDPLPIGRLWGVGRATGERLRKYGVETIGQLRALPAEILSDHFGKHGDHLRRLSLGIDERRVIPDREAKSISHETTFDTDITDREILRAWLLHLTEQVAQRVRRQGLKGSTVQIKVRFSDFRTITRAITLPEASDATSTIWKAASGLLMTKLPSRPQPIRLLGVGISGFDHSRQRQQSLFADVTDDDDHRLDASIDAIRNRFGRGGLSRGSHLNLQASPSTNRSKTTTNDTADHS